MIAVSVVYLTVLPLLLSAALFFLALRIEVVRLSNADAIAEVVAQLGKVKDEIVARIAGSRSSLKAGEDLSGPLADLSAAAQALDDVVPDTIVDEG